MGSVVTLFVRSSGGGAGNGSGEFLDGDGHILTNNHVISSAVSGGTVVGYDDSPVARMSFIDLTTVRQDAMQMAELAVQAAAERVDGERVTRRDIVLDPTLLFVAPPAQRAMFNTDATDLDTVDASPSLPALGI